MKYARFHPEGERVKKAFIAVTSGGTWRRVLDDFYAGDAPGIRPPREAVDEVNATPVGCGIG
jgi:hypothetical protein